VPYKELAALYQNARVIIFASESENCPNIPLAALAAWRPVLYSSIPPMPEFGGDALLYFDPSYPEALAQLLVSVLNDPARLEVLGERAAHRVFDYEWMESTTRTWNAIRNLAMPEAQTV
jgi:glycosyltransferase involved in cell wall biosynthesis